MEGVCLARGGPQRHVGHEERTEILLVLCVVSVISVTPRLAVRAARQRAADAKQICWEWSCYTIEAAALSTP